MIGLATVAASCWLGLLAAALLLKTVAYWVETVWFLHGQHAADYRALLQGPQMDHAVLRDAERDLGRPRWVFGWADRGGTRMHLIAGFAFATPALVALGCASQLLLAKKADGWLALACSVGLELVVLSALLTAPINRLVLGPLDALNPDLRPPTPIRRKLAEESLESMLPLYFLVLVLIAVLGFAGACAGLQAYDATSFHVGASTNWLYFSVVTVATVGFGDVFPQSQLAQTFTMLQVGAGPLLLAWLLSNYGGGNNRARP